MQQRGMHEPKEWVKKLGRRIWGKLTTESRILAPVSDSGHFSLLDLDLKHQTVTHHDSYKHKGNHIDDTGWVTAMKVIGEEILRQLTRRTSVRDTRTGTTIHNVTTTITEIPSRTDIQTQQPATNTCLIHTFNFVESIIRTGSPNPLPDDAAVRQRKTLSRRLRSNMMSVQR